MTKDILQHLKIGECSPGLTYLQDLMTAYCTFVPWESVSKIVKKTLCNNVEDCVRSEKEFWTEAFTYGTGGTCYESNWAFYKLLQSLRFECYLTINKIVDKSSVHSAIVVTINNTKYIADIGYPLYAPIPLIAGGIGHSMYQMMEYRSVSIGSDEFIIENFPHPQPYLYHLQDFQVDEVDYLKIAAADYCETGLFLDRIIIRKIINNTPTRFDSKDLPYNIHKLQNGSKTKTHISSQNLVETLSDFFNINVEMVRKAFDILKTIRDDGAVANRVG